MSTRPETLRVGTRGSDLARWQTRHVISLLQAAHPGLLAVHEVISTRGDYVMDTPLPLLGGKGIFTAELVLALLGERIDCVVHSLKDLPTESPPGLVIGAIPLRASPADALISRRGETLATLPEGAAVGTSSTRRMAQLRFLRPDLRLLDIRGNVDTRIRKALEPSGPYDAIVLACAGLARLGHEQIISQVLDFEEMLPAPGQGALAVQIRDEEAILNMVRSIHHEETALAVMAERSFLAELGGGCAVPIAAYGRFDGERLHLRGRVLSVDGASQIDLTRVSTVVDEETALRAGRELAQEALSLGAMRLLANRT